MDSFSTKFVVVQPLQEVVTINKLEYCAAIVQYANVQIIALFDKDYEVSAGDCIESDSCFLTDMVKKVSTAGDCFNQWGFRVVNPFKVDKEDFVPMESPLVTIFGRLLKKPGREITIVSTWHKEFYRATLNVMDERRMFYRIPVLAFSSRARKLYNVENKSLIEVKGLIVYDKVNDKLVIDIKSLK